MFEAKEAAAVSVTISPFNDLSPPVAFSILGDNQEAGPQKQS